MERIEIIAKVREQFNDREVHTLEDIIQKVRDPGKDVLSMDVKSVVLGLLRVQELELTENYDLRLRHGQTAGV